jgi:hypothetical protein
VKNDGLLTMHTLQVRNTVAYAFVYLCGTAGQVKRSDIQRFVRLESDLTSGGSMSHDMCIKAYYKAGVSISKRVLILV